MIVTEQSHVFECRWCVLISKVIGGLCVQHIILVRKHNNSLVLIKLIRPDIFGLLCVFSLITDTFYRVAVKLRACICVDLVAVAVRPTNGVLKKMFESNPNLPQAGLKSFLFK